MPPRLTSKVVLHPRANEDGTHRVRIRLTKDRKTVFVEAGFTLTPKDWNERANFGRPFWVRRSTPDFESLNSQLDLILLRVHFVNLAYFSLTAAQVRDYLLLHSDEPLEDLQWKAREASDIRLLLSRASPEILAHFERLLSRLDQTQLEVDALRAELADIMASQIDNSWVARPKQRAQKPTDAQSMPRHPNRRRFQSYKDR
jgi:tetrahydromethanopterin S-methyltransferase subunit G